MATRRQWVRKRKRMWDTGGKPQWSDPAQLGGGHAPSIWVFRSGSFGVGAGSNPAGLGTELGGAVVGIRTDSPPRCSGQDTDLPFDQRGSVPPARIVVGPFFRDSRSQGVSDVWYCFMSRVVQDIVQSLLGQI